MNACDEKFRADVVDKFIRHECHYWDKWQDEFWRARSNGANEKNFIMNEVTIFFGRCGNENGAHGVANEDRTI